MQLVQEFSYVKIVKIIGYLKRPRVRLIKDI